MADLTIDLSEHPAGGWYAVIREGDRIHYATGRCKTRGQAEREAKVFTGIYGRGRLVRQHDGTWEYRVGGRRDDTA